VTARQTRALIENDLRVHGVGMACTAAVLLLLPAVAGFVKPGGRVDSAAALVTSLNFILMLLWGDWLVSREKTKGTIAWLRTLPVPDHAIVLAKVATYMAGCLSMWVASTLLYVPQFFFPARWREWLITLCVLMFAGTVSVCGRFRFSQKVGQVLPPAVLGLLMVIYYLALRVAPAGTMRLSAMATRPSMTGVVVLSILGLSGAVVAVTIAWMRRAETVELTE
jgi:hypothetical protein